MPRRSNHLGDRDQPRAIDRRTFVTAAVVTTGTVMIAGLSGCENAPALSATELATPALRAVMAHEQILAIGRAYLASALPATSQPSSQATSVAQTVEALQTAIRHDAAPWPWSVSPTLEAVIVADFEEGRTVLAAGWLLSVSEARQCALYALARS